MTDSVLLLVAAGVGFLIGRLTSPLPAPSTVVVRESADGKTEVVPGTEFYRPHLGPPLRSYAVNDAGAVEYSEEPGSTEAEIRRRVLRDIQAAALEEPSRG